MNEVVIAVTMIVSLCFNAILLLMRGDLVSANKATTRENKLLNKENSAQSAELIKSDSYIGDLELILLDLGITPPKKGFVNKSINRIQSKTRLP